MDVPFISNTSDNKHCTPVSFLMIVQAFEPSFVMPIEKWAKIAGFEEGKGTWAAASLVWLKTRGYKVKHITNFDYSAFAEQQSTYLIKLAGEKVGQWMIDNTNMTAEVERVKKLLDEKGLIEQRVPTQNDIQNYLNDGYVLRVNVNSSRLARQQGYDGHSVVIINYDSKGVYSHDPGLPPLKNRHVNWEEFEAAWADPTPDNKELDAIKKS